MTNSTGRIDSDQKALEINLNDRFYGTFAEIGAGQEVARHFFKVGAAAGTIAKSMSAYDKTFSDCIYGEEASGRYVCESRIHKMLDHEYALMDERLTASRPDTCFFVFADTVAAINYSKTIKGHGWLGLRFQLSPQEEPNDLLLHVRMLDNDYRLQQNAIGILGVNMVYGCFKYYEDIEQLIRSLMDDLHDRVSIDMIDLSGPRFTDIDNRVLSMYLVKHGLTEVAMFNAEGKSMHPSEFLYKKSLMVVRGNYRPPTIVSDDVFHQGFAQFKEDFNLNDNQAKLMAEITLENLGHGGDISDSDFVERADMLCHMGHETIISSCHDHQTLVNYLSDYKIINLALVVGARELENLINKNTKVTGGENLLVTFGRLFSRKITVYVYPALNDDKTALYTSRNLPVHPMIKYLYQYLIEQDYIVDIEEYDEKNLNIFSFEVLEDIKNDTPGWEDKLPKGLAAVIREKGYFEWNTQNVEA